jgi:hypothetical protein
MLSRAFVDLRLTFIFDYVRTQFSKDDVDASDSLLVGLFDDDFDGDGRV